jgi:ABC-type glutathione transport system ATPase component
VLLVSSGAIREPHCSALPQVHLKKISSVKSGCRNHGTNGSSCRSPVFDIATNRSTFGNADPRLELILNDQLDLHSRILGVGSNQRIYRPFPSNISDMKHFFVGQEHIMSELKSILDEREFDVASHSSKVLVLVFAGVSGTGKTMLAELIANVIHGQSVDELKADGKFFQQDMGGWQNPEDSDALFGVKQASYHS